MQKIVLFASPGRVAEPTIKKLVNFGWTSVISFRVGGKSEKVVQRLSEKYGSKNVYGIASDISSIDGANNFIEKAINKVEDTERIALINVASQYPPKEAFERWENKELNDDDWKYFNSNFGVMQSMTRAMLNKYNTEIKKNPNLELDIISFGDGRSRRYFQNRIVHPFKIYGKKIIDITTDDAKSFGLEFLAKSGVKGRDFNPYMLSKLLIQYATRELALDNKGGKVRINALAPGIMEPSPNDSLEIAEKFARDATILQRIGGVSSATDKIIHLLEDNAYMTGDIIPIDGGQYLVWLEQQENLK